MAFTGVLAWTRVGERTIIATGLSLANAAAGTIGDYGDATADENLPSGFPALSVNTKVSVHETAIAGVTPLDKPIIFGIAGTPKQLTVTNLDAAPGPPAHVTGELRIRIAEPHTLDS